MSLTFDSVSLRYEGANGTVDVLHNIDLDIKSGEFVTVVGPSGCGKSSLLKLACGIISPTTGDVLFQDKLITGTHPERGMIFQDPTLFPWLTVEDNVGFGLKMKGIQKERRLALVHHYLSLLNLSEFAKHHVYQLSGGMKQRVALARTLINEPKLILLDEPFAALDAFTKTNMQSLVTSLWSETKKTFLFVTHDIREALRLGSRMIIMSSRPGRIIETIELSSRKDSPEWKNEKRELEDYIFDMLT